MNVRASCLLLVAVSLGGCSDDAGGDAADGVVGDGNADGPCAASEKVGFFETTLHEDHTSVQGNVADAVAPAAVPDAMMADGPCRLLANPSLFCDPSCSPGFKCDANGECVPEPLGASVGVVTVDGLAVPVEMTASAPTFGYSYGGSLDHPGFEEGAELALQASGDGDVEPFALDARGVTALETSTSSVHLELDVPTVLQWMPPGEVDLGTMHVLLNIAQHGFNPGWIECEVPDSGSFELPTTLTNALLELGYSGYPTVTLTRRSVDSTATELGCIEWRAQSAVVLEVEVPGLTSCSNDADCEPPETCQANLSCG